MDTRYFAGKGKILTGAQLAPEFKKSRLIAGQSVDGDEYDTALNEWLSTHDEVTRKDQRNINAAMTGFLIVFGIFALIALISLTTGAVIAFVVLLTVGLFAGFITSLVVIALTKRVQR